MTTATFLPIADRELRIRARKKATYRWRVVFALVAGAMAGIVCIFVNVSGPAAQSEMGSAIFNTIKWFSFVVACCAGVFLTADSVSEEKRDGTLGLLFLTDLRGYDVVLGKLLATSVRTMYGLLAVFPIMAISFIMGGVMPQDFWLSVLALCNTLFFSLALGMMVSAASRQSHKTMSAALAAMALIVFVLPHVHWVEQFSPVYMMMHSDDFQPRNFWKSAALVHLTGWCCLAMASWLTPRSWQETGARSQSSKFFARFSGKQKLGEQNPICWIISRDRWAATIGRAGLVLVVGLLALTAVAYFTHTGSASGGKGLFSTTTTTTTVNGSTTTRSVTYGKWGGFVYYAAGWVVNVLSFALEFWLALHVCRFYSEGRKSGFLELVRVTPVKPLEILHGHWLAIRKMYGGIIAAQMALMLGYGFLEILMKDDGFSGTIWRGQNLGSLSMLAKLALSLTVSATAWLLGLVAIVWFSIWMAMKTRGTSLAVLWTFCWTKALPWLGGAVTGGFFFMFLMRRQAFNGIWSWPVVYNGFLIIANLILIRIASIRARAIFIRWPD